MSVRQVSCDEASPLSEDHANQTAGVGTPPGGAAGLPEDADGLREETNQGYHADGQSPGGIASWGRIERLLMDRLPTRRALWVVAFLTVAAGAGGVVVQLFEIGASTPAGHGHPSTPANSVAPDVQPRYSYRRRPLVHPHAVQGLFYGPEVVIDLVDHEDRYRADIKVDRDEHSLSTPWVRAMETINHNRAGYQHIGTTASGVDVLHFYDHSTNHVVLLVTEYDYASDYGHASDEIRLRQPHSIGEPIRFKHRRRELVRFLGELHVGYKWSGDIHLVDNEEIVVNGREFRDIANHPERPTTPVVYKLPAWQPGEQLRPTKTQQARR